MQWFPYGFSRLDKKGKSSSKSKKIMMANIFNIWIADNIKIQYKDCIKL